MTYDNGNGYLFVYTMDGDVVHLPGFKPGSNRLERRWSTAWRSRANCATASPPRARTSAPTNSRSRMSTVPSRKMGYAAALPGWNMFIATGAYLDDLDAQLKPIIWALGLAMLAIAAVAGAIAWLIGRSITGPLGVLGARMESLADGALDEEIPGVGRGDEVGAMAKTVQVFKDNALRIRGLEQVEAEAQGRIAASAVRRWRASPTTSNAASTASFARSRPLLPACRAPRNR